jgi:hypothetical protein
MSVAGDTSCRSEAKSKWTGKQELLDWPRKLLVGTALARKIFPENPSNLP